MRILLESLLVFPRKQDDAGNHVVDPSVTEKRNRIWKELQAVIQHSSNCRHSYTQHSHSDQQPSE